MTGQIKLAAFDLGGVMINVDEAIPIAEFSRISGKSEQTVFDAIFAPDRKRPIETGQITSAEHAKRAMHLLDLDLSASEFWQIHCTSHSPNARVGEIVVRVSVNRQITIASNLPEPHWDWTRANLPYSSLFTTPILSFDIGEMKPDIAYYEQIIKRSGYQPEQIFFTDDRPENIEGAAKLGIRAFLFESQEKLVADLRSCGIEV